MEQNLKEAKWWILPLMIWGFISPFAAPINPFYSISDYLFNFLGSAVHQFINAPFILVAGLIEMLIFGGSGCVYGIGWLGLGIYWPLTILVCGLVGYILRYIFKLVTNR